jgi:hypothetical protein
VGASTSNTPLVGASLKLVSPKCRFVGPVQALSLSVGTFKARVPTYRRPCVRSELIERSVAIPDRGTRQ